MNTNDATDYELTPDYPTIDPVKSWKEGYQAGVEAKTDLLAQRVKVLEEALQDIIANGSSWEQKVGDQTITAACTACATKIDVARAALEEGKE